MPRRSASLQRLLILGLSGPIVALNLWLLSQIFRYFEHLVTVLTVAAILAFLLSYPVRFFERARITRAQAVIVVLLVAVTILVTLGLTLVPMLINQATQLLERIPGWLEASRHNLDSLDNWAKARNLPLDLQGVSGRLNAQIESQLQRVATQLLELALGTVSGLLDSILVIVLAFYMLLYGDRLWQGLINLFPPHIGVALSDSLRLNFQNFFISQFLLGLFMVGTTAPVFIFLKVPFALLFALVIGSAELIPFIGATLGIGLVTLLVAFQDVWLALRVAIAAITLQQIKDNLIAPRLMGSFTGLNPIWIFVALLMGLQIAGFLGIVVAVPLAGAIKSTIDAIRGLNQTSVVVTDVVPQEPSLEKRSRQREG